MFEVTVHVEHSLVPRLNFQGEDGQINNSLVYTLVDPGTWYLIEEG